MSKPSPYSYPAEKMMVAATSLMLPHPGGEEQSIVSAFQSCQAAFGNLKQPDIVAMEERAQEHMETIRRLMDTTGLKSSDPREGTFLLKTRLLTEEDRRDLSEAVHELAHWFRRHGWDQ